MTITFSVKYEQVFKWKKMYATMENNDKRMRMVFKV